jgi:hypothetical protein
MALVGKVLDGAIKLKGRGQEWWNSDWSRSTLGNLLREPVIKDKMIEKIGDGGWQRLRGSGVYVRNVGSHQDFERVSMDDAVASARVLFDFLTRWWS